MKELKDFLDFQKFSGASDKEIIVAYFVENDMEEEAMEICHRLAKTKIEKMKAKERIVKEWSYTIPSDYLYENYPVKIATMLHRIELDFIVNGEVTGGRLKWAKENVPNIQKPYVYFFPCMEWLEKNGIKFMEVFE